jgi:hypothetical protein
MKRFALLLPACLLMVCSVSHALDPPTKIWEKWYYQSWDAAAFRDIELTDTSDLFITGYAVDWSTPQEDHITAFLLDEDGDVIWEVISPWFGIGGYDGAILLDGSYAITGVTVVEPDSSWALFIMKIDQSGSIEWTKVYDYPTTREEGYGITCLPDGGFAVCGRVNGTGNTQGQAWILRTDANGDTLWTDVWGTYPTNYGKSVLYANNMICVLAFGRDDSLVTGGPHLLFYDLDGNYLHGTNYSNLDYEFPMGFCLASDGGYTFVTETGPVIWHTDQMGATLWWYDIWHSPNCWHEGHGIRRTMDNGYLFYGWDGQWIEPGDSLQINAPIAQVDTGSTQDAWLVRFDSEGNELWNFRNEMGHNNHFYSAVQLPEGGYIAGGTYTGSGYLVRYAPETGIEGGEPSPFTTLDIAPNPFSSSLSISYSLPELAMVELSVYDLFGRKIESLESGSATTGEHTVIWNPDPTLPDGCYLIVLDACRERAVRRCVKLD